MMERLATPVGDHQRYRQQRRPDTIHDSGTGATHHGSLLQSRPPSRPAGEYQIHIDKDTGNGL